MQKPSIDYKKFYEDIRTHVEYMVTPEMRAHAYANPNSHDLSFQIMRLLSGYSQALNEINYLRGIPTNKEGLHSTGQLVTRMVYN